MRGEQRRGDAEDDRRHDGHAHCEDDDGKIDGNLARARQRSRGEGGDTGLAPKGQEQADADAAEGEQQAFGQLLPEQTGGTSAEARTHGKLGATCRGPGEQQIGDVGAGDDQDETDRAEQDSRAGRRLPMSVS